MQPRDRILRILLLISGPLNLFGSIIFLPPSFTLRSVLGVPEAPAMYLWILSTWIFAFGVAYAWQGWTYSFNRGLLAVGAFGKMTFAASLSTFGIHSAHPVQSIAGASPDFAIAVAIILWLCRTNWQVECLIGHRRRL